MKYIKECVILFGITCVGEFLNHALPLPVPSGVYGLFLLLLLLCSGVLKLAEIEATGTFLLDIMPVLFIPAAVGLMESYGEMRAVLLPVGVICLVSTVLVMAVTGIVAQAALRRKRKEGTRR